MVKMRKWLEEEIVSKAKSDSIWQELYDKAAEDGALEGRITAHVTYKDGMLFRKRKAWIPSDPSLRRLIMESEHDSGVAGHMGMDKTLELVDRNFYWPEMAEDIEDYVRSCEDCRRTKLPDIRGMAHCILLNCPMCHGMQFPWTSSRNFPSQMAVRRSG